MRKIQKLVLGLCLAGVAGWGQTATRRSLEDGFRNPPREYSMEPLWSWNGTLEREKLIWQIDQMVEKGVYGAYMHSRDGLDQSGTPYFSKGFWDAVETSVAHGAKVGFRTWIYDEDKWPSGDAGGRTRAANPERYTAMGIWPRTEDVRGGSRIRLAHAKARAVVAAKVLGERIDASSLVDVTSINARGEEWQAPAGEWRLFVFEPVQRPVPLPNYLNPDAVKEFLNNTYEEYAKRVSGHFGKTIPGSFFDEIFNIVLAWDPLLEERFRREKGYELRPMLPLLFADGGPRSIKVRCDYFDVFTRQYEEAWFKQISEWCARHNLMLTGHTNEELHAILDQGDYFRTWRHPQMPGTDNEDFRYTFPRVVGSWKPKQLSSVAHMYGRQRAMVEALGGAGWTITLEEARYGVNMLAAYGLNSFVMHLFHYTTGAVESMDDWPNSWFFQNPYWKYFKKLADYTSRLSYMGSQGEHVADVAVLYPVEEVWSQPVTRGRRETAPVVALTDELVCNQIDFDMVDTDTLLKAQPGEGGRARIGTETYRVLILPDTGTVSRRAYARVAELAASGLKVIALGRVPRHSAESGAEDPEVLKVSASLFSSRENVAAEVGEAIARLRRLGPADLSVVSGEGSALRYSHRRMKDLDIYFVANGERKPFAGRLRFMASGSAERWDAETGEATTLAVAGREAGATSLDIELGPWQAHFVVFDRSQGAGTPPAVRRVISSVDLKGPWRMQLAPTELDYQWKADPGETRVEVPVADFRLERGGVERAWRRVKLVDALNQKRGASRYLSAWDAFWITRFEYQGRHPGILAGANLRFEREIPLDSMPVASQVAIVADGVVECFWNGQRVGQSSAAMKPLVLEKLPAVRGGNRLEVVVRGAGYLLVEGDIRFADGRVMRIRSDRNWKVTAPGQAAQQAHEIVAPPFGKWGEPERNESTPLLPAAAVYRISIPHGATSLDTPEMKGRWEASAGGAALRTVGGRIMLPARLPAGAALEIRVRLESADDGLIKPLVFHCTSAAAQLGDWTKQGLDWYSGRVVYSTEFNAPQLEKSARLELDLGTMWYTGEVWVNGALVDSLVWAPYRVDITKVLKPGANRLAVVVANLSANEMQWNIFDDAISRPISRWWHDGHILREQEKLRSGLAGPVRLVVMQ